MFDVIILCREMHVKIVNIMFKKFMNNVINAAVLGRKSDKITF